jgi:hypothetical protein
LLRRSLSGQAHRRLANLGDGKQICEQPPLFCPQEFSPEAKILVVTKQGKNCLVQKRESISKNTRRNGISFSETCTTFDLALSLKTTVIRQNTAAIHSSRHSTCISGMRLSTMKFYPMHFRTKLATVYNFE